MADMLTIKEVKDLIPTFDGDQSTLNDFIEACDFAVQNIDQDYSTALIFIIKSKLVDKARKFISSRNLHDWKSIKELLIGSYGDCRDVEALIRDLTNTSQKQNETPRAYLQRVQDLLTRLRNAVALDTESTGTVKDALNKSHEKIGLKTLIAGLNDPLGQVIRAQRPNTTEEAGQFIIEEENIAYLRSKSNSSSSKPNVRVFPKENYEDGDQNKSHNLNCRYCKKNGHSIENCRARIRASAGSSVGTNSNVDQQNFQSQTRGEYAQNNPQPSFSGQWRDNRAFVPNQSRPNNDNRFYNQQKSANNGQTRLNHLNSNEEQETGTLTPPPEVQMCPEQEMETLNQTFFDSTFFEN